jgi:HK97 family phage major capsid protein/HK97 family phage prohead protease
VDRAYSLLTIKSVDEGRRLIKGTATTPSPDRQGDILEPLGASFPPELPLLLHHKKESPVGVARFKKPTKKGIDFEAELPIIDEPGAVKDEVDRAWHSVLHKLIRGVSIGFRVVNNAIEPLKSGGLRFLETEILELSLVTVPANQDATLAILKSIDAPDLAATGLDPSRTRDTSTPLRVKKDARPMTTAEQITQFENSRAAKTARMTEIMTKSDNSTLGEAEREEYTTLESEVDAIDEHLPRLRKLEKTLAVTATRIEPTAKADVASEQRGGNLPRITVTPIVPKGTAFTRFAMALASAKGDSYQAISRAKAWSDSTPEVATMVENTINWHTKAAVAAGTTTDATWAGPLAPTQTAVNEFLELLRPRTLIGRVPGFRQVPFNTAVPSQTGGGTYSWVGQGNAKPVTSAAFATVTVPFAKAAGIIVLTEELVRLSTPSAEATVREEMIAGMGAFLDTQLVDPAVAAVANVNPASITNGAATAAASGVTGAAARADLAARVATFTAANIPLDGSVWLMSDSNAFGLGLSLNALGQPLFPGMSRDGGSIMGIPVIVSNNVGNRIILVHAPSILYADEGGVQIDVSREASIQMDSAPSNPSDATTVLVSLWQRNLVGLRAERMITWIRARTAAVTYISAASYNGT